MFEMELQDNEGIEFALSGLDIGPNGDGECLEDDTSLSGNEHSCSICMEKYHNPRVLSCLHTFCLQCLEKIQKMLMDESGDGVKSHKNIQCPKCKQETKIGTKGVASLPIDYVISNMLEMSAITSSVIKCQSCKTKEPAVARCADCANCLCAHCNSAHEYMHRFEKHEVVKFEDLCASKGGAVQIHASIMCKVHPFANMTFYCHTCQVPLCNSCALMDHPLPDHRCELLTDAEPHLREVIQNLAHETKAIVELCLESSNVMTNELQELQSQTDNAKALITETVQSYKAILDKISDELQDDLKNLHHTRELKIMETFYMLDRAQDKIENSTKFAKQLLDNGNTVEVASLNGIVIEQLRYLIENIPKHNTTPPIEFHTNMEEFESGAKAIFGSFTGGEEVEPVPREAASASPPTQGLVESTTSPGSSASIPASMQSSLEGSCSRQSPLDGLLPKQTPQQESPAGMQTSLEQATLDEGIRSPQGFSHEPPVPRSSLNLTCMGEYNLQQLASLSSPNVVTSGNPQFPFAEPFTGSNSTFMKNLEALAQVGHAAVNGPNMMHTPSPSPPPTLGSLINDVILSDHLGNGMNSRGAMILGRASPSLDMNVALLGNSPALDMMNSMRTSPQGLEINTTLGGLTLRSLSGTPSPILSQPDPMDLESMRGLSLSTVSMNSINGFHPRAMSGKLNPMQIRCKYGQLGPSKAQFNSPHGFCLGADEDIIVADTNNHRIQIFDKNGNYKFQFGIPGKEEGQLWYPRKVAVMRTSGKFVVCDRGNERSRMQIFTRNGHFVKKIAIRYVDIVAGLAVTVEGNIVAVDSVSPTVFVISESGELIRWFDCSDHMREPSDIAINGNEFFVCDFKGHCVVVFSEEGIFMRRIGCESITNFPNGIDISDAGDVLVGDSHGNRFHVAVFTRDGSLLSEFECPYVKVSRCCGLKITSEGYIVTLAKNNHHVLILNTLYIV